jgi:hypothetical protein
MTTKLLAVSVFLALAAALAAQTKGTKTSVPAITYKAQRIEHGVNAPAADFAPIRYGDRLYFSSVRHDAGGPAKLYSCTPGNPPVVDAEFDLKKTDHVACPAIMPDASRMFFTICRDEAMQQCELWYRDREYEGTWGPPVKLPDHINLKGSNSTQPTIGWDVPQRKYVLIFASNRPGGQGGMDLWSSAIDHTGKFGEPACLPFNTPKDEVTPFFDQSTQMLYFSSNGLGGLGRYDVFSSQRLVKAGWGKPSHLPKPFNSAYDDLFYNLHEATQTSYLASDRPGSICDGGNVDGFACFDLYEVRRLEPGEEAPPSDTSAKRN